MRPVAYCVQFSWTKVGVLSEGFVHPSRLLWPILSGPKLRGLHCNYAFFQNLKGLGQSLAIGVQQALLLTWKDGRTRSGSGWKGWQIIFLSGSKLKNNIWLICFPLSCHHLNQVQLSQLILSKNKKILKKFTWRFVNFRGEIGKDTVVACYFLCKNLWKICSLFGLSFE